ncbi:MAG: hypothetical protein KDA25_08715, partial [Phycisphaerales bacterium]|nr:hypothetical protein [Phycisphaerales bacterium]
RTPETVARLLRARGRLQRFLDHRQIGALRIVILAEEVDAARRLELREYLEGDWSESQVFLRSGSSLQPSHLERADVARASVVLIPGADFTHGGAELNDTRVVKALLTVEAMLKASGRATRPHIVAEIFDALKVPLARSCVDGPLEVIASDQIISRLIYQNVRHPAVVRVLLDLFTHRQGNSIYLRAFPELAGRSIRALAGAFPDAVVLGLLRGSGPERRVHLDPTCDVVVEAEDLLVLLGETYERCRPTGDVPPVGTVMPPPVMLPPATDDAGHRLLVLGWSHKLGPLLGELDALDTGRFEVTVMSKVGVAERDLDAARLRPASRVTVHHVRGDYASAAALRAVDPSTFDSVVFLASGWMRSSEEADARTILGYLTLDAMLAGSPRPPQILVELLDPDNGPLLAETENAVLVSPRILSHLLAHVALRPELHPVLDALLGAGGTELGSRVAADLELVGRTVTFADIQVAASARACVAIGLMTGAPRAIHVNPARDRRWTIGAGDTVIVLELCAGARAAPIATR